MTPELVLAAYRQGIFPMADDRRSDTLRWIRPQFRGALLTHKARVPSRLRRRLRSMPYRLTASQAFRQVMLACAESKKGRETTWINDAILDTYCALADSGHAQSIEVWDQDRLVGGLYGVHIGAAFFGESMFSRATDTSKIAMVGLLSCLSASGIALLDTQFWTPHLSQFGVDEIPDAHFQLLLGEALRLEAVFCPRLSRSDLVQMG